MHTMDAIDRSFSAGIVPTRQMIAQTKEAGAFM